MKTNISRQMTFLGLVALVFYSVLLANGKASFEIMPQYAISIIFFLLSGKMLRQTVRTSDTTEQNESEELPPSDWALRTTIVNWLAVCFFVCVITVFLIKPPSMTFYDFLIHPTNNSTFTIMAP